MSTKKKSFRKRHQHTKKYRTTKQFYPMRGCSRTQKKGGWGKGDLAYPSYNVPHIRNPNLAYTGNNNSNLKNAYPSQGHDGNWSGWLNSQNDFNGGGQNGGDCGCNNSNFLQNGGANNGLPFGEGMAPMKGTPYAGGTSGAPLIPGNISTWPGVKSVGGNGNYYKLNTYNNDFTTNPRSENSLVSLKGGKRGKKGKKSKKMKGGYSFSNSIAQDFVNIGRQLSNGVGNAFNAFNGYKQTSSPLPWKGQLANTPTYSALKLFKY